jgi:amino acid adenylation domain-containing protein
MLDRLYGQGPAYNVVCAYRARGPLDVDRLQRSLDAVVRRHEVLRTALRFEDGDVVQVVLPELAVPITRHDLSHVPMERRFHAALSEAAVEGGRPFDLEVAPLLRVSLYRADDQDHLLLVVVHHAIFDGWSENVFFEELAACYRSTADGSPGAALDGLSIQYRDFAIRQREQAESPSVQASLAWWQEQLTGAPAVLNLPLDHPRPSVPTRRGGRELLFLPKERVDALKAVGRRRGATLFMTLLAAYAVVLHRYTGDREVIIGTVLAGRTRPELEDLIGFFVNTVALRADLGGEPTFVELLDRIKHLSLDSHSHQEVPFERVVESLQPARAAGHMPLFQTIFVLQNISSRTPAFADVRLEPIDIDNGTSKCDLVLSVGRAPDGRDGLCCSLAYDADLFESQTAVRLLESYRLVLDAVSVDPDRAIASVPVVGATDQALLERWSDTPGEYSRASTIHRVFEAVAARTPEAVAVTSVSGSLTYGQLDARANRLAARLRTEGVQRGDLVGLCLERTLEAIAAQLAVLKTGAAYLPLDPADPASRLSGLIQDGGVRVVLSDERNAARLPPATSIIALDREAGAIALESPERGPDDCGGDDLAYVMFTSGSTGRPNGVRIPHRGVLRLVLGTDYVNWDRVTTFLQMAPPSFDASTFEVWGPLLRGRRLVLFPERVPTVSSLEAILRDEGVDCLWLTSAFFNLVVDERPQLLARVSQLIVGGEALSAPHVRRAQAELRSTQIINGYGPTECTTFACCHPIPPLDARPVSSIPIGRPIGSTSVQVLDSRQHPVPIGVVGELYIGGDGVALGYHDRPQLTAERFVADPTGRSAMRWYRTGDRVRWNADGVLEYHGRMDAQMKVRGFRVEPGEVEAACRRHPGVRDACVVLEQRTATDARLVAYVVEEPGAAPGADELRRFLTEELPGHLVPQAVVPIDVLPLTPNGKVDRPALTSTRLRGEAASAMASGAPRNATEEALADLWRRLLRVDSIGIHDDFFALGGHSLLAVRMFSQIHARLGRSLPFSSLLRHPTIAQLSTLLESPPAPRARRLSLVPLKSTGSRPPLLLLHGVGNEVWTFRELAAHLEAEQPAYGIVPAERMADGPVSLTDRAAEYVEELEAFLPQGPFVLGGHCTGAVAAFEVGRQLRARGRSVPLLLVFDYSLEVAPAGVLAFAANAAAWISDDLLRTTLSHNVGRVRSRLHLLRGRLLRWIDHRSPPDDIRDVLGMWRFPDYEAERLQQDMDMIGRYRFCSYDGAVHVFRARTRALTTRHPPHDLGWGRFAVGPLTVETVPGSHDSMFRAPFARILGERLNAVLRRAFETAATGSNAAPQQGGIGR